MLKSLMLAVRRAGWDRDIVIRHEVGHCNGWRRTLDGNIKMNTTAEHLVLLGLTLAICVSLFVILAVIP